MSFRITLFLPFILMPAFPPALAQDFFPQQTQLEQVKKVEFPSDDQLRRAIQEQQTRTRDTFRKLDPAYRGLDKSPVVQQAIPSIQPQKPNMDLNGLIRQYADQTRPPQISKRNDNDLLIFVSLTMPEKSLEVLVRQAAQSGAVLVLRGLKNNSIKETTAIIGKYEQKYKASWQINPPAFVKFGIKSVPTFVLARPASPTDGCAPPESFAAISGDVSLDYALETVERRIPSFADIAQQRLSKLER